MLVTFGPDPSPATVDRTAQSAAAIIKKIAIFFTIRMFLAERTNFEWLNMLIGDDEKKKRWKEWSKLKERRQIQHKLKYSSVTLLPIEIIFSEN